MTVKKELLKTKKYIFMQVLFTFIATAAISFIPAYNKYLVDALIIRSEEHTSELQSHVSFIIFIIYLAETWLSERFVCKSAICF